jgi:hypoxanthine phosphoribosyltransferase
MTSTIPDVNNVESLLSAEDLRVKVAELGAQISRDYADKDLTLVGILKGSLPFLSDLMRAITIPVQIDFLECSSYEGGLHSTGVVRLVKDLSHSIQGKDVLIVEDIVDTGRTLNYLLDNFAARASASTAICTLLDKPSGRLEGGDIKVDYIGFSIPNHFVVGYGLDLAGYFRNLPYVGIYTPPEA